MKSVARTVIPYALKVYKRELWKNFSQTTLNVNKISLLTRVLAKAAKRAGLDESEVVPFLRSDGLVKKMEEEASANRGGDVNGGTSFYPEW